MSGGTGSGGLPASALLRRTDLSELGFETTDELEDAVATVEQERAERALSFGMGIRREGFHIFALGPENAHKREIVREVIAERAAGEPPPADLCYMNDFEESHRPTALRLPPGRGRELSHDMDVVLEGLASGLRAALVAPRPEDSAGMEEVSSAEDPGAILEERLRSAGVDATVRAFPRWDTPTLVRALQLGASGLVVVARHSLGGGPEELAAFLREGGCPVLVVG